MKLRIPKTLIAALALLMAGATSASAKSIGQPRSLNVQVHHALVMLPWYGVFDNLQYQVNGGEVKICRANATVKRVMEVSGFTSLLHLYDTEESALAAFA